MRTPPVEWILVNGRVYTQDPQRPEARAVAVGGGRILAVGSDADIEHTAGPDTRRIDLNGRTVLPGFVDAHIHFYEWALKRRNLALAELPSFQALLETVREAAAQAPSGSWILGQGWNEVDWPENRMPTRTDLDGVAPDHPVVLWRCDLHLAAANSRALAAAGIHRGTPDPAGGEIDRDAEGRPTGILRELAIHPLRRVIPPPTGSDTDAALQDGASALHRVGITGIHDIRLMNDPDGPAALQAFQRLNTAGQLALRCWVTIPGDRAEAAAALGLRTGFGDARLRIGHLKYFADGGMGARTAWMVEPFLDAGCGMPTMTGEELLWQVQRADSAGLAVMIHAVGDHALREIITAFEQLEKTSDPNAGPSVPHRIEHAQMIHPDDLPRLAKLPVAVSMTPPNMILDINLVDTCLGPRGRWAYAFRDVWDSGVPVMFSSDCPVCDPAPLIGIYAAVTRRRRDGTPPRGWYPEGRMTVAEAVAAYTRIPAAVHGLSHEQGIIAPGRRADLLALGRDIYRIDPMEIPEVEVDLTAFDGEIVHRNF